MNKKGTSLVELVIAMGIFMVVATIAVGAFATVTRMKSMTGTMKESQQKLRIALEMVTRLSRQASKVIITTNGSDQYLNLFFEGTSVSATRFQLKATTRDFNGTPTNIRELYMADCTSLSGLTCSTWGQDINLLSGTIYLDPTSRFTKSVTDEITGNTLNTSILTIDFKGKITDLPQDTNNPYYNDNLSLKTSVVLEGLK